MKMGNGLSMLHFDEAFNTIEANQSSGGGGYSPSLGNNLADDSGNAGSLSSFRIDMAIGNLSRKRYFIVINIIIM